MAWPTWEEARHSMVMGEHNSQTVHAWRGLNAWMCVKKKHACKPACHCSILSRHGRSLLGHAALAPAPRRGRHRRALPAAGRRTR